jgi:hypothetical protein
LKVLSKYYGDEADELRHTIRTSTKAEIQKNYLNFYAKDFSEISVAREIEFTDDTIANIVTSSEQYLIKNFWTLDLENKTATVYASILSSYLKKPETRIRTMPLAITHPRNISQTIKILLPEPWNLDDSNITIESGGFIYHRSKFYSDNTITLRFSYKTKKPFIEASETAEYVAKTGEIFSDNGLTIYKPLAAKADSKSVNFYLGVGLVLVVGFFAIRRKMRS